MPKADNNPRKRFWGLFSVQERTEEIESGNAEAMIVPATVAVVEPPSDEDYDKWVEEARQRYRKEYEDRIKINSRINELLRRAAS